MCEVFLFNSPMTIDRYDQYLRDYFQEQNSLFTMIFRSFVPKTSRLCYGYRDQSSVYGE